MSTTVSWLTCRTRTPLYSQGLYSSFCCSMRRSRQKLVRSFMALGGIASLWFSFACHKQSPPSYVDEDAYNVYSSILPHSSPLVVREATTAYDLCEVPLDEQAEKILRPALDNFTRVNSEPWLLRQSLVYFLNRRFGRYSGAICPNCDPATLGRLSTATTPATKVGSRFQQ
jgi:hypothetical protein